ncbi:hypothetical protein C8T65DRAFT_218246 [Cerioporus squamosus]|nr:hypothetical protein C8T65DRAFT_218246 [Cerioporus squamosus]
MEENYKGRAKAAFKNDEDQLATEFTALVNKHVLAPATGKLTKPPRTPRRTMSTRSLTTSEGPTDAGAPSPASPPAETTNHPPRYPVTLVDVIPPYVMRLSVYKPDKGDVGLNKADSAIFLDDPAVKLEEGRPNWVHQRFFCEFKTAGIENDPFDDGEKNDVEPQAAHRVKVRGQLIAYADRLFAYQHRKAAFSLLVLGGEFRFLRWDRSGLFVTEKVSYVARTRTLVELLLGFAVLSPASQGIDTTATLLDESSADYQLMTSLALCENFVFEVPVVSCVEGAPLPSDVPLKLVDPTPSPASPSTATTSGDNGSEPSNDPSSAQYRPKEGSFIFDYVLDYFKMSLAEKWPRYHITVGSDEFLIGQPIFETTGLTGRGTRGYVAWHKQSQSFVFLKDAWRPFYERVETEGDILKKLNEAGVVNIPTLLCHEELGNHVTVVSDYARYDKRNNQERKSASRGSSEKTASKSKKRTMEQREDAVPAPHIRHFVHHRMVTKEVCIPLVGFRSSEQLVRVITDCIEAHASAVTICKIMHRDISSGNILIIPTFVQAPDDQFLYVQWRGLLSDWELSKPIADSEGEELARQPERTGTWKYMSVACITNALHIVGISDELEAFFNVLMYNAIRYLPHNREHQVALFVFAYFSRPIQSGAADTFRRKTQMKDTKGELVVGDGAVKFGTPEQPNKPLDSIIWHFLEWLQARYLIREYEEKLKELKAQNPSRGNQADSNPATSSDRPAQRLRLESAGSVFDIEPGRAIKRPTAEVYAAAANVQTHDTPLALLRHALTAWSWPKNDRLKDHMRNFTEPKMTLVYADITFPKSGPSQDDATRQGIVRLGTYGDPVPKPRRSKGSGSIQMAFTRSTGE